MEKHIKDILSGILISLGCYIYLKLGGIAGAILFAFGIITIVGLNISLYTGIAGTDNKFIDKMEVLFMNIIGSIIGGILILLSDPNIHDTAYTLCINKMDTVWLMSFVKAILCGIIVDISVYLSKVKNSFIPLLIGIPLFILSGFNHSIADTVYFVIGGLSEGYTLKFLIYYVLCITGNYIGCNFRRIFIKEYGK